MYIYIYIYIYYILYINNQASRPIKINFLFIFSSLHCEIIYQNTACRLFDLQQQKSH